MDPKSSDDTGKILSETIRRFMSEFRIPNGLQAIGYTQEDVPELAKATFESKNEALRVAPRSQTEEQLSQLFEQSLKVY